MFDVRYLKAHDGGRLHRDILVKEATIVPAVAVPGLCPGHKPEPEKRSRKRRTFFSQRQPVKKKKKKNVSTPEERLVEDLKASGNQPRGWRRAALRVKLKLPPLKKQAQVAHEGRRKQSAHGRGATPRVVLPAEREEIAAAVEGEIQIAEKERSSFAAKLGLRRLGEK